MNQAGKHRNFDEWRILETPRFQRSRPKNRASIGLRLPETRPRVAASRELYRSRIDRRPPREARETARTRHRSVRRALRDRFPPPRPRCAPTSPRPAGEARRPHHRAARHGQVRFFQLGDVLGGIQGYIGSSSSMNPRPPPGNASTAATGSASRARPSPPAPASPP
jgi:hypothetical protein